MMQRPAATPQCEVLAGCHVIRREQEEVGGRSRQKGMAEE